MKKESRGVQTLSRNLATPPKFPWHTRVLVPLTIFGGIGILLLYSLGSSLVPAIAVTAVPVIERSTDGIEPTAAVVQAAGWIEPDPFLFLVTALTDGIIEELLVLEGEKVKAGQIVARLVSDNARLSLKKAEAEAASREAVIAEARARLAAAQIEWDNPIKLEQKVSVAKARLQESRALLSQLKAEQKAGKADLERLRGEYDRVAPLGKEKIVSKATVMNSRTRKEGQEAVVESLTHRTEVVRARIFREETEQKAAIEDFRLRTQDKRELEEAKSGMFKARAELSIANAILEETKLALERHEVKAQIDGVVVERFKSVGSKVVRGGDEKNSAGILSLYDPEKLQVRVDVPLSDAGKISVGQKAEIVAEILPDRTFKGTVTRILHIADIQKNTLQVKVSVENPSQLFRTEMLARVKFLAPMSPQSEEQNTTGLFAPRNSIQENTVWVVENFDGSHGYVQPRRVETSGNSKDSWLEISSGLKPGDLIVTSSFNNLKPGSRVKVTRSESSQE